MGDIEAAGIRLDGLDQEGREMIGPEIHRLGSKIGLACYELRATLFVRFGGDRDAPAPSLISIIKQKS